jgi:hypothetical protein
MFSIIPLRASYTLRLLSLYSNTLHFLSIPYLASIIPVATTHTITPITSTLPSPSRPENDLISELAPHLCHDYSWSFACTMSTSIPCSAMRRTRARQIKNDANALSLCLGTKPSMNMRIMINMVMRAMMDSLDHGGLGLETGSVLESYNSQCTWQKTFQRSIPLILMSGVESLNSG